MISEEEIKSYIDMLEKDFQNSVNFQREIREDSTGYIGDVIDPDKSQEDMDFDNYLDGYYDGQLAALKLLKGLIFPVENTEHNEAVEILMKISYERAMED